MRKADKIYPKKQVSFCSSIKEEICNKTTNKCQGGCGHRNIPPKIIHLFSCKDCGKPICSRCSTPSDICFDCCLKLYYKHITPIML